MFLQIRRRDLDLVTDQNNDHQHNMTPKGNIMKRTIATIAASLVLATSAIAGNNNTGRDYVEGIAANTSTSLIQVSTKSLGHFGSDFSAEDARYSAELADIEGAGKAYALIKSTQPTDNLR